jgi:diguanylate cyclase
MIWSVGIEISDALMQLPSSDALAVLDFRTAARALLQLMQRRSGMDLWMVTRTAGEDWIVLDATANHYGVREGDVFCWSDSFCSRMVAGTGPRCAPDTDRVPVYCDAPIARLLEIRSYVGVPLCYGDGSVFGTLCAISPDAKPETLAHDLPMVELMASMLSALLVAELRVEVESRSAQTARDQATREPLTGLYNRRGWDEVIEQEESRCRRFGSPACVVSLDIDELKSMNDTLGHDAGDRLIARAAEVLRATVRHTDLVARVGGDEFVILATESDLAGTGVLVSRIRDRFAHSGIKASIGIGRRGADGLVGAWRTADAAMYEDKRSRKRDRCAA